MMWVTKIDGFAANTNGDLKDSISKGLYFGDLRCHVISIFFLSAKDKEQANDVS